MSTIGATETTIRTYGNWRHPRLAGLGKLSFFQTMALLALLIVSILVYGSFGLAHAAVLLLSGLSVLGAMEIRDAHGVSVWDKGVERVSFARRRRARRTMYRSGPIGVVPGGRARLPGLLSGSRISEHVDSYDRRFALIHHGNAHVSVIMGVAPSGIALVDQDRIDQQVAHWGAWLADLGSEIGIVQASVCVETVPDTGGALERQVNARLDANAPAIALSVVREAVSQYRAGAAQLRCTVTLTFDTKRMSVKKRSTDQVAREIGTRLPYLTHSLEAAGTGPAHLLTAVDVTRLVRVAYDPASEPLFEEASAGGDEVDLDWEDAGPVGARVSFDSFRHDSGLSRTWVLTKAPTGVVQSGVLSKLLSISRDVERKRVTLLLRPIDAAMTGDIVERDMTTPRRRLACRRSYGARRARGGNREEERAGGSQRCRSRGLYSPGDSDCDGDDLDDTAAAITSLASASKLRMRPAYGAQDSAFALALPWALSPRGKRCGRYEHEHNDRGSQSPRRWRCHAASPYSRFSWDERPGVWPVSVCCGWDPATCWCTTWTGDGWDWRGVRRPHHLVSKGTHFCPIGHGPGPEWLGKVFTD